MPLINHVDLFDVGSVPADTPILAHLGKSPIKIKRGNSSFRITLALSSPAAFAITETRGAVTKTFALEGDLDLVANAVYTWSLGADKDSIYDFKVSAGTKIEKLQVSEDH